MSDLQQAIDKLRSSPHYKELAAYEPPFNPFEIAGVTHRELTHSSVLAWLLRDETNKEFRQKFVAWIKDNILIKLQGALDSIMQESSEKTKEDIVKLWEGLAVPENPEDSSLEPKIVRTEKGDKTSRIDVFAHFKSLELVIGIEVKVWADEQPDQVERYQKLLCQKEYSGYKKAVVFLTPTGWEPKTTDKENAYVPVLAMSWGFVSKITREMQSALGEENDFRMQFSQQLERNVMNETEEQRIVRELLSEGDNAETLAKIIDHESSLQGKVRELLSKGDNAKTLAKIIDNMPSLGDYSDQWKRIVARVCGVKEENSIEVKTYTTKDGLIKELKNCIPEWQNTGLIKELKICIPEWREAGLPFTLMLYKYQKASVRILLYKNDLKGSEAELKEFANRSNANRSNGVVNGEFSESDGLDGWNVWYPVLTKDGKKETPEHTLIDNIWSEDWEEKAEKRLREQIEGTGGLLSQINEWIKTKGADKG